MDPDPCNVAVEGVGSHSGGTALKPELDTTRPSIARVYDYWLGGKDNFAADREMADEMERCYPGTRQMAVSNRRFLVRAVTWAAGQGISQFLDAVLARRDARPWPAAQGARLCARRGSAETVSGPSFRPCSGETWRDP
ncbi:MAG TPA: SAM-dependent methyltransferase [Streptosporangiaceae bacterium]|nr:SAM-dependent methyltransferase [Streptosporangiaceae bacterium]